MLVEVHGVKVPLVMLGTSPFVGAGQFGSKGLLWRRRFLHNAEAMAELMKASYEAGAVGVHIIPEGSIPEAVRLAKRDHPDFKATGTLMPRRVEEGLEELVSLEAQIIFLHPEIGESHDEALVSALLNRIRDRGCVPGVATHNNPPSTVRFLLQHGIDVPVLLPFNKLGYSMGDRAELERLVDTQPIQCIGMKVLAAGRLPPEEAFEYVSNHKIKAVTVGAVAEDEIKQAAHRAIRYLAD